MDLGQLLTQIVPFIRTVGIVVDPIAPGQGHATATLPYRDEVGNHIQTAHAGAAYTLGETASGGVVLSLFADQVQSGGFVALKAAHVRHTKAAPGDLVASATLVGDAAGLRAQYDEAGKLDLDVQVRLRVGDVETAVVTYTWAVRAPRD